MTRLPIPAFALTAALMFAACSRMEPPPAGGAAEAVTSGITTLAPASDAAPGPDFRKLMRAKPGELLVRFKAGVSAGAAQTVLSKQAVRETRSFRTVPGLRLVKLSGDGPADAALASYRDSPEVLYVEPNYILSQSTIPNDPRFPEQWGLHNTGQLGTTPDVDIDAPEAWDVTTGSGSIVVATIDSGVDYRHEDLAANIFSNAAECTPNGVDDDGNGYVDDCHGIDVVNADSDPLDDDGHGTAVAGVIGAVGNNGVGIAGVAWSVQILPCKFIDASGSGTTADAVACLDYVAALKDRGVNIVATNNSYGGLIESRALLEAIDAQMQRGILFIAPAGNDGEDNDVLPTYPCTYYRPNVLCISSISKLGVASKFSGYGRLSVHFGAPGEDILTTAMNGGYQEASGTSLAVPQVVGAIALLKAQDPGRDWRALKNLVLAGTSHGMPQFNQHNVLNLDNSLHCSNLGFNTRVRPVYGPELSRRISRAIGDPVELAVLHIDCAAPAGGMTLTVQPGGELVTLRDNGLGKDAAAGDGIYTAEWTPTTGGTFTIAFPNSDEVQVDVDPFLKPGFPLKTLHTSGTYQGLTSVHVVVGNIDADPRLEVIASALSTGPVYAWHADGGPVTGWPTLEGWFGTAGYPSLGEFDANRPGSEVFVEYFAFDGESSAIYRGDGMPMPGWPRPIGGLDGATMVADLDGDGIDEVFSGFALRADGTPFSPTFTPSGIGRSSAIADLDGDEVPEVVTSSGPSGISQGFTVSAERLDGTQLAGFPITYRPSTTKIYPLVGDVDGDGAPEIVVLSQEDVPWDTTVRIIGRDGVEKRHWVIPVGDGNWGVTTALADLDGDGFPEIVAHGAKLYVFKGDGSNLAGWPVENGGYGPGSSAPVVGDVDGDGFPDVIAMTQPWDVSVWDRHGVMLQGFPRSNEMLGSRGVPAIADLDLDGRNDIILKGEYWQGTAGSFDSVWALDAHGPARFGPIEWGQYKGDAKHSGTYITGKNLPNDAYLSVNTLGTGRVTGTGIDCGTDCIERIPKNTVVTLTATPAPGRSLARWRGACQGTSRTCQVSVDRYRSVLAEFSDSERLSVTFIGSGSGTVTANSGELACPGVCVAQYPPGSNVVLTATAAPGSLFIGWQGTCPGTGPCSVTMTQSRSVTANFRAVSELTVTTTGSGTGSVASSPDGISCGITCRALFERDQVVTLFATANSSARFTGWSGACSGTVTPCTVTMSEARAVTATFERLPGITVTRSGSGNGTVRSDLPGISCSPDCFEPFNTTVTVSLTATPDPGSTFIGWGGACAGTGTCVVSTDTARSVDARFELRRDLNVTLSGLGTGSVSSSPAGIDCGLDCSQTYDANTVVTLTAAQVPGSGFDGWSGACSGTANTCTVTMNAAQSVGAAFRLNPQPPPTSGSGGGGKGGGGRADFLLLAALGWLSALRCARRAARSVP